MLAKLLLRTVHLSSGKIVGSRGSCNSFRSKLMSGMVMYGPFTAFATYNPSELFAEPVMRLAGRPYSFDETGKPEGMPNDSERHVITASRPVACATYFNACKTGIRHVAYGFTSNTHTQDNDDCIFGKVLWSVCICESVLHLMDSLSAKT